MSGFRTGQFVGQTVNFGRLMYYHRIARGSILDGAHGGVSIEAGRVGQSLVPGNEEGWQGSGSIFVASDTPIGPVYLGYGRAQSGQDNFYFYLGRAY